MPFNLFLALMLLLAACVAMRRAADEGDPNAALWGIVLFIACIVYL